jgi:guanylate kinase
VSNDDDARPAARLTVLSGPSGVGKDSVIELIRARSPWVWLSVSCTTRVPRPYEVDGTHYHFVDRDEFRTHVREGQMLEWAEFAGNLYGTPRGPVEKHLAHAREEMASEAEFDVTVVNDNVEHAAEELVGLLGSRLFTSQPLH